jgi:hypothetical protein
MRREADVEDLLEAWRDLEIPPAFRPMGVVFAQVIVRPGPQRRTGASLHGRDAAHQGRAYRWTGPCEPPPWESLDAGFRRLEMP